MLKCVLLTIKKALQSNKKAGRNAKTPQQNLKFREFFWFKFVVID